MLKHFMAMLAKTNVILIIDGPYLLCWETGQITGQPENEVVRFEWLDDNKPYSLVLTESGIEAGKFDPTTNQFDLEDQEGDPVSISLCSYVVPPVGVAS